MNILLCGHGGVLCRQLIQRFDQERHMVYLITGGARDELKISKAFQIYPFSYSNENISRIMKSSSADVLVLEGAHDPLYDWRKASQQSVHFLSDLTNLLTGAKAAGIRRVVFLSALNADQFVSDQHTDIPNANEREMYRTLNCAEDLVHAYADEEMQTTVLRLPAIFGGGDGSYDIGSICHSMAEQYLWNHELHYAPNERHREIYYPDAAEAVRRVVEQEDADPLLQVAGISFTEKELVQALQSTGIVEEGALRLQEEGHGLPSGTELSISHELELPLKYTLDNAVKPMLDELQRDREREERKQRKIGSFWREHLLPIAENIGLFIVILLVTWLIRGTWVGENLDLFTIYVLLIGVTWGMAHSLFAALLAGAASFFMMQEGATDLVFDYGYFIRFLELIVVGVTSGYMRDKYRRKNLDLNDENAYYAGEVRDLTRINDSNVYVRNLFEKRLMGYRNSLAKIYEITSQLDYMESRKVLFHAVQVCSQILDTPHVAVYIASGNAGFFRLVAAGSKQARQMGKSIRYDENSFMYRALSQKEIYQNRQFDSSNPTFAGAVYRSDTPIVIVMVWMDQIEQVNLYNSNMLAVLCRLLESSVHRAVLYEESIHRDSYLPDTRILHEDAFRQVVQTYEEGRLQGLLEYVLLRVKGNKNKRDSIEQLVRDTDVLGEVHGDVYVLLSNSNKSDAHFVVDRFAKNGLQLEEIESL